jgi:hypothetical protein
MLPDGQRIIGVVAQDDSLLRGGQARQIVVVENWFEELKARSPKGK